MTVRRNVSNPADLLLRISRTPAGLHISSPQLPDWAVVARGSVPIAQAIDTALVQHELDVYASRKGQPSDLAAWDAACEALAASGHQVLASDVVVVRAGARAVRPSGVPAQSRALTRRPSSERYREGTGKYVPQHDPMAWTDLGNGQWRSPRGHVYAETASVVQRVIARRAEVALMSCQQPTLDEAQAAG